MSILPLGNLFSPASSPSSQNTQTDTTQDTDQTPTAAPAEETSQTQSPQQAQDTRLIAAPEAVGTTDALIPPRSHAESVVQAQTLEAAFGSDAMSDDQARAAAQASRMAAIEQSYLDAISGPVAAPTLVAENVEAAGQSPYDATPTDAEAAQAAA